MKRLVMVAMTALSSTGCAFLFKGSEQDMRVASVPREADVRVDGRYLGETPTNVPVNRNSPPNIVVSKDGFKEQYVHIEKHPDAAWWFWDIATCVVPVTLCIPILFDAISGAWMTVDDSVRVKLDAIPAPIRVAAPIQVPTPAPAPVPTSEPSPALGF